MNHKSLFGYLMVGLITLMIAMFTILGCGEDQPTQRLIVTHPESPEDWAESSLVSEAWMVPFCDGRATGLEVDPSGNIYVTGWCQTWAESTEFFTAKYDSAGNQVWVATYNGTANGDHKARDIALDHQGNIYVAGTSAVNGASSYYVTIKYDSYGNEIWVARYYSKKGDYATSIMVDQEGSVYVTGYTSDYSSSNTVKYNADGEQVWVASQPGWDPHIVVYASDSVYVVTTVTTPDGNCYLTRKYAREGNESWRATYKLEDSGVGTQAGAIAADASGNIYVTGICYSYGTFLGSRTVKYSTFGQQLWVAEGAVEGRVRASAIDPLGNIWTVCDSGVGKYDSGGHELWHWGPSKSGFGDAISIDANGDAYLVARHPRRTGSVITIVKFSSNGDVMWRTWHKSPSTLGGGDGICISVAESGAIYVTDSRSIRKYVQLPGTPSQ